MKTKLFEEFQSKRLLENPKPTEKEKTEMTEEIKTYINDIIIKKTLSGPKRFRPLSREEMENKISELEKQNQKSVSVITKLKSSVSNADQKAVAKDDSFAAILVEIIY